MSLGTPKVLQQLEGRLKQISLETEQLHRVQRAIGADVARQDKEIEDAWDHLAEVTVPTLDVAVLDAVAARLRLPTVTAQQVIARRQATLVQASNRRVNLLADRRIQDAEAIENEVQIRVAELDEALQPLHNSTSLLEAAPLFHELLAHRYGTDEYTMRFWQLGYYTHWKHGDLVVEAHGPRLGLDNFKAIAARYVEEKTALEQLKHSRSALLDRRNEVKRAQGELAEVEASIADIDTVTLRSVRTRVKDHLRPLAEDALLSVFVNDEAGLLACKRIIGVGKKKNYLSALQEVQVKGILEEMRATTGKLARTRTKLGRSKNAYRQWPEAEVERMLGQDRRDRWSKRRERLSDTRTRIVEFHHYDRWSPGSNILWWDVMSDGRLDGDFIPEVRARGPYTHQHIVNETPANDWRDDRSFDAS